MRAVDLVAAALALVAFAAMLVAAARFEYWLEFAPGPAFFPLWVALAGGAASLGILVEALRRRTSEPVDWPDRAGARRVVGAMLALLLLFPLVRLVGFVGAVVLVMLVLLVGVERCRVAPSVLTTAIGAGLVYGIFASWLKVPLPKGPLGF